MPGRLRWQQTGLLLAAIVIWKLSFAWGLTDPDLLPDPWRVMQHIAVLPLDASFQLAVLRTVSSAVIGLAIAVVLGVPIGLSIGSTPAVYSATRVLIDMGRSFPMIALMPVMVLLLGTTPQMLVTVAALATFWPVLLQSCDGARQVEPLIAETTRAFRIPRGLRFWRVMLPSALPFIVTGVRIGAAFSLLVTIGVELMSATPGLGREIGLAQEGAAYDLVFALVFYSGVLGLLFNHGLAALEHRMLDWHVSHRDQAP